MVYIGYGLHLKYDYDLLINLKRVYQLHTLAKESKKRKERVNYLKRIIETLTTVKKARFYHLYLLKKILLAADLWSNKAKANNTNPIKELDKIVDSIAPRINKFQNEVYNNCTSKELNRYSKSLALFELEEQKKRVLATHMQANKYIESLNKDITKIQNSKKKVKEVKQPEGPIKPHRLAGFHI